VANDDRGLVKLVVMLDSGCVAATLIVGDCFWQPLGANRFAQERLGRVPLARRSQQKIDGVAFFVVA